MSDHGLLVQNYLETAPVFSAAPEYVGVAAGVVGRAKIGSGAVLGKRSIIRADGHYVKIGNKFSLGDDATIHIAHEMFPAILGDDVTVGRNSVIHACTVGDHCYLGDNVVILDGAKVAAHCAIADDSIIYPGAEIEGGWLYGGRPAKPIRVLELAEIDAMNEEARTRVRNGGAWENTSKELSNRDGFQFVAVTARLKDTVCGSVGSSIWYGCRLEGGRFKIEISERSNIQDNTKIKCVHQDVTIGAVTTIGHNVTLVDCAIGDRCLIGIGSAVARGTIIHDDVLLAAGAATLPEQVLESGWLYGGKPAAKIKQLDDNKYLLIKDSSDVYVAYAQNFSKAKERYLFTG